MEPDSLRIKTIHSSLAIEGNTLSEEEVRDIIDGKNVVAPIRQIQEVKNASSNAGQSGPFIEFMLNEIYKTVKEHQGEPLSDKVPNKVPNKLRLQYPGLSDATWEVYLELKADVHASAEIVGNRIGISDRMVRKHISILRDAAIIERVGGNKTGYWKLLKK